MDLFIEWINKREKSVWIRRALTDRSYKNIDHTLTMKDVNTDLATYGDAVIKLCYSEILLDNVDKLTEIKSNIESDYYLCSVVGRYYDIKNNISKDDNDGNLSDNYDYDSDSESSRNQHKYIATAVEAVIGAIYKEIGDLKPIIELLDIWKSWYVEKEK